MLTKNACDVLAGIAANEMIQKEAGFIGTAIQAGKHLFNPYTRRMVKGTIGNAWKMLRNGWANDYANAATKIKGIPGQAGAAIRNYGPKALSGAVRNPIAIGASGAMAYDLVKKLLSDKK